MASHEVRHESLPQWWYVGAEQCERIHDRGSSYNLLLEGSSLEFRTNKGKIFRHVAGWGSGEASCKLNSGCAMMCRVKEEDMVCFKSKPLAGAASA